MILQPRPWLNCAAGASSVDYFFLNVSKQNTEKQWLQGGWKENKIRNSRNHTGFVDTTMWIEIPNDEANNKFSKQVILAKYSIYVNDLYASEVGIQQPLKSLLSNSNYTGVNLQTNLLLRKGSIANTTATVMTQAGEFLPYV